METMSGAARAAVLVCDSDKTVPSIFDSFPASRCSAALAAVQQRAEYTGAKGEGDTVFEVVASGSACLLGP